MLGLELVFLLSQPLEFLFKAIDDPFRTWALWCSNKKHRSEAIPSKTPESLNQNLGFIRRWIPRVSQRCDDPHHCELLLLPFFDHSKARKRESMRSSPKESKRREAFALTASLVIEVPPNEP